MSLVSVISTMNVERPFASSSKAENIRSAPRDVQPRSHSPPMRVSTPSSMLIRSESAGTYAPIWAMIAQSASMRTHDDLPPMFGPARAVVSVSGAPAHERHAAPVMTFPRGAPPPMRQSFGTNGSARSASSIGWRPATTSNTSAPSSANTGLA
jgi:hypothetical protein